MKETNFKVGDIVYCKAGGFQIECKVLKISDDKYTFRRIKVQDVQMQSEHWVNESDIEHDLQYYRNKQLESLGL